MAGQKKELPLVSILIPCFNAGSFIAQAIESCLNQTYANIEIIVINDGSTDNSWDVITRYGDKIKSLSISNSGQSAAINHGLKIAKGYYVKFFDSDDILTKDAIYSQVMNYSTLDNDENYVVFGYHTEIDENGTLINGTDRSSYPQRPGMVDLHFLLKKGIITGSILHKMDLIRRINGWDELCPIMGNDFDLVMRLWAIDVKFIFFEKNIYYYRNYTSCDRSASVGWIAKDPALLLYLLNKWERIMMFKNHHIPDSLKLLLAQKHVDAGRKLAFFGNKYYTIIHFFKAKFLLAPSSLNFDIRLNIVEYPQIGNLYIWAAKIFGYTKTEKVYSSIYSLLKKLRNSQKK